MNDMSVLTQAQTAVTLKDEERTRCEVWTRVMGYHRPVTSFNKGKRASTASGSSSSKAAARWADAILRQSS